MNKVIKTKREMKDVRSAYTSNMLHVSESDEVYYAGMRMDNVRAIKVYSFGVLCEVVSVTTVFAKIMLSADDFNTLRSIIDSK